MDEQAFVPGTPETELDSRSTYLLGGGLKNKSGHATLTNDRVLFFDEFYRAGKRTFSPLQRLVATKMQDRLDKRGPVVDILANTEPPGYRSSAPRPRTKLGPYLRVIEEILASDREAPPKHEKASGSVVTGPGVSCAPPACMAYAGARRSSRPDATTKPPVRRI